MRAIQEEIHRQGAPLLSLPQLRTLARPHPSPGYCQFHLPEHLGVTLPTSSSIVKRRVRRAMVTRAANLQERRRVVLTLMPFWHLRRASQSAQTWMPTALSQLPPASLGRIKQGATLWGQPLEGTASGDPHQCRMRPLDQSIGQPIRTHNWRPGEEGGAGLSGQ